jgi:erythritol transport system ATP-binding protein
MSGRAVSETIAARPSLANAPILLTASKLELGASGMDEASQAPLHGVSFTLGKGEILGIYGLLGAGRTELLESLAGARRLFDGSIVVNGVQAHFSTVSDAAKFGIVLVPEDRQRDGLIPEMSIHENIAIGAMQGIWLSRAQQSVRVLELARELNIVANDLGLPVTSLSGGNQQKVLIARCLMRNPVLLLLDEPTRGVDVGAKAEIYAILRRVASKGVSVLFTSSEIEETRTLADRALVLCQGRVSAEFSRNEITDEALFAAASPVVNTTPILSSGAQLA